MSPGSKAQKGLSKLWYIKGFNLLRGMNEQQMEEVAAMTRMTKRRRGDLIYLPGDVSDCVYFVSQGRIKLTSLTEEGHEVLLDIIGPGEIFGEVGAIEETPRTNSAQTLEDTLLCEMQRKDFEGLLAMHPDMSIRVLKRVGLRLKKVENQLLNLTCKDVPTRVTEALVELVSSCPKSKPKPPVKIELTQQDLANLIGASRQETARALKRLKDSGLIELRYRRILVKAPELLLRSRFAAH